MVLDTTLNKMQEQKYVDNSQSGNCSRLTIRRPSPEFVRVTMSALLVLVAACAPAAPAKSSPAVGDTKVSGARALWSRYVTGDVYNAKIYQGAVVFSSLHPGGGTSTQAFDVRTGRHLWKRAGTLLLSGSPLLLAAGTAVANVDARTGRAIWRSVPLCAASSSAPPKHTGLDVEFGLPIHPSPPPAVAVPTYAATIGKTLYVGCNGGKISALRLSNGHVLASAHPIRLDDYDQIVPLGHGALGIGGEASGAYMARQSAIVKRDTLATIIVFGPGHRIIGTRSGDAVVADVCCQGAHSDSWPADIERVSLTSGETISEVSLHPYPHPLPPDSDLPGPGVVLAVGNTLYVATHSALFAYDLTNLRVRPRILYGDLADLPMLIDGRYLSIREGEPRDVRRVALLDAYSGMRVVRSTRFRATYTQQATLQLLNFSGSRVRSVTVDGSCTHAAFSERYVFVTCRNLRIASRAHLGGSPKAASFALTTEIPESIAVYAMPDS